jgi:hypothetical protein
MQSLVVKKLLGAIGMSWNYRAVRFINDEMGEYFEIKEVFYDKLGELAGYSEASVFSETAEGLKDCLDMMAVALTKPVIKEEEFFSQEGKV